MSTINNTPVTEKATQENVLDNALTIVELEERFEMTVAAEEADRCWYTVEAQ